MTEEVLTVVRLPLADISDQVRKKHRLSEALVDARIEADTLVMYFARDQPETVFPVKSESSSPRSAVSIQSGNLELSRRRRRSRGRRNRMKTRGWEVIDRFTNSKGQTALVYRPLVDVLRDKMDRTTSTQQKALIAQVLKSNGNRPSSTSVDYYWLNTVEYLRNSAQQGKVNVGAN